MTNKVVKKMVKSLPFAGKHLDTNVTDGRKPGDVRKPYASIDELPEALGRRPETN